MQPRHRAGALAAALMAMALQPTIAEKRTETRKEPSRFAEQRKAEAEAKRRRKAEKRHQYRP